MDVRKNLKNVLLCAYIGAIGLAAVVVSIATAQPAGDPKSGGTNPPAMKLPPGWTESDMQACMAAGTPGKMQEFLAKSVGNWQGKSTMWMGPGAEAITSECNATISPVMGGRYTKCDVTGTMPGMGPFTGLGYYGFDNVSQKFVSTWVDNMSTGIMYGTGELSADQKAMTWHCTFNCPITKKATPLREIDRYNGDNGMTLEMYSIDPKSGQEYKMMVIEYTRKP